MKAELAEGSRVLKAAQRRDGVEVGSRRKRVDMSFSGDSVGGTNAHRNRCRDEW